jgi:hypothetical protein
MELWKKVLTKTEEELNGKKLEWITMCAERSAYWAYKDIQESQGFNDVLN